VGGFRGAAVVVSGQVCAQISEDARSMESKSCIGLDPLRRCGRIIVGAGAQFVSVGRILRARKTELEESKQLFWLPDLV
jgi:hypothetical protein